MILLIVLVAVLLAILSFVALSYVQSRPRTAPGTRIVNVSGLEVTVTDNPAMAVRLADVLLPVEPAAPAEETTPAEATPIQAEPEQTAPEPTAAPTEPPPPPANPVNLIAYTVQQGDVLYEVARVNNTSITLMAVYNISAESLVPGNVLQVPVPNPAYCPGARAYAVAEGDTVFNVARKFGADVAQIQAVNALGADSLIEAGEVICVP